MPDVLTFRPSSNESVFLEEKDIIWSDFCHNALREKQDELVGDHKFNKRASFRAMCNDLMLFFIGVAFLGISYFVLNIIVFWLLNIGAIIGLGGGLILLTREIMYNLSMEG